MTIEYYILDSIRYASSYMRYYTYLLECADGTYYCGITNNLENRINNHNSNSKAAKYTKGRRPVTLKYFEEFENKSDALRREIEIKKLSHYDKFNLIKG